jgi:hypothetical protein
MAIAVKLDPDTLRELIDMAGAMVVNRRQQKLIDSAYYWGAFVDWLQGKLDELPTEPPAGGSTEMSR